MRKSTVALAALLSLVVAAPAAAQQITVTDGKTQPVFDYAQAVRERVLIPQPGIDQDGDGADDRIAVEIIRPPGSGPGLRVPAIVDASPYYTTVCRGNESECIGDVDGDGVNDRWPLFYDNFFVPRGYAYVLAEMDGTGNSTGCPLHGGPGDIAGMKSVIDWLNGRVYGYNAQGEVIVPNWHNGSAAMIGKSYDGTLANGVAATGVEGLKTIVPISAISEWYRYSRQGGIRFNTNYPASLASTVTNEARRPACAASRAAMSDADGDETGDLNGFWAARDYEDHAGDVRAAVFATHGLQDDNVKLDHLGVWWDGLKAAGVPRKLWLLRAGHVDPFDSRRAVWVDTLHRWFDHWLLGVDNGIMAEPPVTIEDAKDTWHDYADWPVPGSTPTDVYLRGITQAGAGELALRPGGAASALTWTDAARNETVTMNDPEGSQANRRVFLSAPLQQDVRISGTPEVDIRASADRDQTNLGALLVDYGPGTQVTRSGEGIANTATSSCWGESSGAPDFDACYLEVSKPTTDVTQWRVTRGILDSSNRFGLDSASPLTPGAPEAFRWPLVPTDHVFAAGHRIGVVLVANYGGLGIAQTTGATVTLDATVSKLSLPIVGGYHGAARSRGFTPDVGAPVLTGVPADITVRTGDPSGAVVAYVLPAATDDESPDPTVTCDPAPGTRFPVGATVVTCTATDDYGNTATRAFTVSVTGPCGPPPAPPEPTTPVPPTGDTRADTAAPRLRQAQIEGRQARRADPAAAERAGAGDAHAPAQGPQAGAEDRHAAGPCPASTC